NRLFLLGVYSPPHEEGNTRSPRVHHSSTASQTAAAVVLLSARVRQNGFQMDSSAYSFRRALPRSIGHASGSSATTTYCPRYGHDAWPRRDDCHNLFSCSCRICFISRSTIRSRWP